MCELRQEPGIRVDVRIAVVDALDVVLRHQDRLRADLQRAQGGGGVGGEERIARAGREDDYAPLLEMADCASANFALIFPNSPE